MAINNGTKPVAPGHFRNESTDICRACLGVGRTQNGVCDTCEGSGKVSITKDIYITVKPYKYQNK